MIGLLLGIALAYDPAAVRTADLGGSGLDSAMSAHVGPFALAHQPGGPVSLTLAGQRVLSGTDGGWVVAASGAAGPALSMQQKRPLLTTMGALQAIRTGDRWRVAFGLVTNPSVRFGTPELAVPLFLEPQLGLRVGEWWVGARGELGALVHTGGPPAAQLGVALWLRVPYALKIKPDGDAASPDQ